MKYKWVENTLKKKEETSDQHWALEIGGSKKGNYNYNKRTAVGPHHDWGKNLRPSLLVPAWQIKGRDQGYHGRNSRSIRNKGFAAWVGGKKTNLIVRSQSQ